MSTMPKQRVSNCMIEEVFGQTLIHRAMYVDLTETLRFNVQSSAIYSKKQAAASYHNSEENVN